MTKDDLFSSICNGDIQNSILLSTNILYIDSSFESLELIYIDVCSYIGTFIYITDISKLIDIYDNLVILINSEKVLIKNIYSIVTKLCILCDIYNKHPVSKCGNMSISVLKNKILPIMNDNNTYLIRENVDIIINNNIVRTNYSLGITYNIQSLLNYELFSLQFNNFTTNKYKEPYPYYHIHHNNGVYDSSVITHKAAYLLKVKY